MLVLYKWKGKRTMMPIACAGEAKGTSATESRVMVKFVIETAALASHMMMRSTVVLR